MIWKERIAEWRKQKGEGMVSALGEYTPSEFWELLDAYEKLVVERNDAKAEIARLTETLKRRIDFRMNEHLIEMKPEYDDSITGFNEAWKVIDEFFAALKPDTGEVK